MTLAQGTIGCIIHDQKRVPILHTKFEDAHDIRVDQVGDRACLLAEILHIIACQAHTHHFDGSQGTEVNMFSQVDLGKAAFSEQTG